MEWEQEDVTWSEMNTLVSFTYLCVVYICRVEKKIKKYKSPHGKTFQNPNSLRSFL